MDIHLRFKKLRSLIRINSKKVIDYLYDNHINRTSLPRATKKVEICVFCGTSNLITKEHVLPKWTFEGSTQGFFITEINNMHQTYNKTTVPACSICNNSILGDIERYITNLLASAESKDFSFSVYESENIIRWLEIIEYKFQVLEARRKFVTLKDERHIPYLADFSLSAMRHDLDFSPVKALTEIRVTRKRIGVKSKTDQLNSLVVFRTKNNGFSFFHKMNAFIFLELPQFKIALFYFFSKTFDTAIDAGYQATELIGKIYSDK